MQKIIIGLIVIFLDLARFVFRLVVKLLRRKARLAVFLLGIGMLANYGISSDQYASMKEAVSEKSGCPNGSLSSLLSCVLSRSDGKLPAVANTASEAVQDAPEGEGHHGVHVNFGFDVN